MRLKKNNIILILLITILIFSSTFMWNFINIPYNHNNILGEYGVNEHHSLNDIFRYLYFVLMPLIGFLFVKMLIEKKKN